MDQDNAPKVTLLDSALDLLWSFRKSLLEDTSQRDAGAACGGDGGICPIEAKIKWFFTEDMLAGCGNLFNAVSMDATGRCDRHGVEISLLEHLLKRPIDRDVPFLAPRG